MGYDRHHAIVVTSYDEDKHLLRAHVEARQTFSGVSEIVRSPLNGWASFMVAPDGSKEGWAESNDGDERRDRFIAWLDEQRFEDGSSPYDWAEVQYGDDNRESLVTRHSDEEARHEAAKSE